MGSRLIIVTTPATSFDLTDLDTVKDELDLDDSENDGRLSRYIAEASIWLSGKCNRVFAKETVAETFRNGEALETLVMARRPVVSIASIVEDGVTLTASDYELDAESGLLYRLRSDCRSTWSWAKIVVSYVGGYVLPGATPVDLAGACIEVVKLKNAARTRDPALRAVETPDVLREEFWVGDTGLPPRVAEAIETYRNVLV